MNEFHFFFETFLKLNNFKIFEMEMNESRSVCFFARMPEVFSLLHVEQRNGESQSGEETLARRFALFRSFVFRFDLSSPKESQKLVESRETRNPAFQEYLSVVDNKYILVKRGREISNISVICPCHGNTYF